MNGQSSPAHRRLLESALGSGVALVGALVLVGWVFDLEVLKRVVPGAVGMKFNSALAFLLCGAAVAISAGSAPAPLRRLAWPLLIAVLAIGALSLAQELLSFDAGIDQLLFRDAGGATRISRPGRMSPATAYCFATMAIALGLTLMPERARLQLPFAAALSASVAIMSALYLTGHLTHRLLGTRWGASSTMAIHTALTFLLLGAAGLIRARRLQASNWALNRAGTAGFAVGVVLMLGATELAKTFATDMDQTTAAVVRIQATLQQLQEIRTDMRTLEGAQRGHLVLGDEAFLKTREETKASVRRRIDSLADTTLVVAPPSDAVRPLRAAIEQRIAYGDRLIAVRRTEGFEAARALFNTGEDVALTTGITQTIAPMVQRARDDLLGRQQHLKEVTATTFLLLPIGSFLGLTVLLGGLFILDHGFERRRQAEQALSRSRAELEVVFDSMAEGIRVINSDLEITQMNASGAGVHGLIVPAPNLRAIMAQVDALASDGRVLAEHEWPAQRALRGDFMRGGEVTFRRKDTGHTVVVEINTAPLPVEPGELAQVVVTSRDVTERLRAQAAVRESQDRLEHVVENLTEGLLIHGMTGEFVHWNRAALAMYELCADEVTTMTRAAFQSRFELSALDGRVVPFEQWPMSRLLRGEALNRQEIRVRRIGRTWERVFSYDGALLHDVSGGPLAFLSVTDVSERKLAELRIQQLNTELEQRVTLRTSELQAKTRELESFCYSVSHDLKAPLRGIDGYSRLLLDEYGDKLDGDGSMFISNVRKATTQMNTLIDDLLAYSQQERRTLAPRRIGLRAFVREKIARRALDLAAVQLNVDVEDVTVCADRDSLEMALGNLIDNAVKFSARATPPVITIRSRTHDGRCVISVQDNGTGFDMRHYDKIFEIFQRLHRAEDYPGTGVGLALVRKSMERMGGRVWADSKPGAGATFYLELDATSDAPESIY